MRPVAVFYSFTGNNRLLAEALSAGLACPAIEVVEPRPRKPFRIAVDLLFRRFPPIEPVDLPRERDHVLVVAPLWNKWIAHPMRSALRARGPGIGAYSVVTLSGGERAGQVAFVDEQLEALTGHYPVNHWALYVEKLVPDAIRGTPKVSEYRVSPEELGTYREIDDIVGWLKHAPVAAA